MRLSIIIPLYNVEKYVASCINSLLDQNLDPIDYEILIIDDGSTDNSVSIVRKFESGYSNIHVHSQENAGVGSARNKGIDLAKGRYIYFIDPDDYLASNVLKPILDYIDDHDLQVLTFSSIGTTNTALYDSSSNTNQKFTIDKMTGIDYIGTIGYKNEVWWYVTKRSFIKDFRLKFIEGRWMEDAIFTTTLFIKAKKMAHLSIDAHRHVKVEGSAMTSKEPKHYIKVIYDNGNAAKEFNELIEEISNSESSNLKCLSRLKARQQSFVFFMMIRILKSEIRFKEVKAIMNSMTEIKVYPLNKFLGNDYKGFTYVLITRLFNIKYLYYVLFLILNPFLRMKN
ncbi:glycosyltransferase [Flavivirga abyssicola]|uniref:glycosyltransferase n=1 Tax=Flavivirga abyssicola TaxID=3063533 RepID=UPI0026DF3DE8|nr:glycosyltransferase [Flavivirga sp. MEBiC07777]WVK13055.1 glycosyltransferase [Flavivirga sp. MEBiC07777]